MTAGRSERWPTGKYEDLNWNLSEDEGLGEDEDKGEDKDKGGDEGDEASLKDDGGT